MLWEGRVLGMVEVLGGKPPLTQIRALDIGL